MKVSRSEARQGLARLGSASSGLSRFASNEEGLFLKQQRSHLPDVNVLWRIYQKPVQSATRSSPGLCRHLCFSFHDRGTGQVPEK
jgi:hypothetical protein